MPRVLVQTWSGDGILTVDGTGYPVAYKLRYEGTSNANSTTGYLEGLPPVLLVDLPQHDQLQLKLSNGDIVGAAIFGGQPCRVRVNTPMPGIG